MTSTLIGDQILQAVISHSTNHPPYYNVTKDEICREILLACLPQFYEDDWMDMNVRERVLKQYFEIQGEYYASKHRIIPLIKFHLIEPSSEEEEEEQYAIDYKPVKRIQYWNPIVGYLCVLVILYACVYKSRCIRIIYQTANIEKDAANVRHWISVVWAQYSNNINILSPPTVVQDKRDGFYSFSFRQIHMEEYSHLCFWAPHQHDPYQVINGDVMIALNLHTLKHMQYEIYIAPLLFKRTSFVFGNDSNTGITNRIWTFMDIYVRLNTDKECKSIVLRTCDIPTILLPIAGHNHEQVTNNKKKSMIGMTVAFRSSQLLPAHVKVALKSIDRPTRIHLPCSLPTEICDYIFTFVDYRRELFSWYHYQ